MNTNTTLETPLWERYLREGFSFPVPTSTYIPQVSSEKTPHLIWLMEPEEKHNGRWILLGGRAKARKPGRMSSSGVRLLPSFQTPMQCLRAEFTEEAGGAGATMISPKLWAIKCDPNSGLRKTTLGKLTHNTCPEPLRNVPVFGHYGVPDSIFTGGVKGTPHPNDGEAKGFFKYDVRKVEVTASEQESKFGANHDLIVAVYRLELAGCQINKAEAFSDLTKLRRTLPKLLAAL
jgi:hypothetical protein